MYLFVNKVFKSQINRIVGVNTSLSAHTSLLSLFVHVNFSFTLVSRKLEKLVKEVTCKKNVTESLSYLLYIKLQWKENSENFPPQLLYGGSQPIYFLYRFISLLDREGSRGLVNYHLLLHYVKYYKFYFRITIKK